MKIITHAPMLAIFAGLLGSLAIFERVEAWLFFIFGLLILIGIALCSYEKDIKDSWKMLLFMILIFLICSVSIYSELTKPDDEIKTFRNSEGIISNVRTWGKSYVAVLNCENKKYVLSMPFRKFVEGMRLNFTGVTNNFRPKNGNFDEAKFWKARGVNARITIIDYELLPIKFSFYRLRFLISRFIRKKMPYLTSSYLRAAWLGERDRNLNLKHREWGTSHLLAVSGFHVGIIILCASKIFGKKNNLIISLLLWTYIFLTGASASALRAGLMIQIAIISRILGRSINGINSVSSAGVILLCESPFLYWDIGFRLSVMAALTIASLAKIEFTRNYLFYVISPVISLVTFAQVTYAFEKIPLVGIFLNVFAPFFFSIAFSVASLGAIMKFLEIPLSEFFVRIIDNGFFVWEEFAKFMTKIIPYKIEWNFYLAFLGGGFLIFILCKSLRISNAKALFITSALTFLSFAIMG